MSVNPSQVKSGFTSEEMTEMGGDDELGEAAQEAANDEDEGGGAGEANENPATNDNAAKSGKASPKPPAGYVPQAALHEARAAERELRDKISRMEALFQRFQADSAPKPPAPEPIPEFERDPAGHVLGTQQRISQQLNQVQTELRQRQAADAQQAHTNEMLNRYAAAVRSYARETPDYNAAYDFLTKSVDGELLARGIADPSQRTNIMQYEEGMMVGRALHAGQDPAQLLYNLAVHRGYKKSAPGESKIDQLQKGAKAAKSLNGGGAANDNNTNSLEALTALADSDPKEFDKQWERMKKKGLLG